MKYKQLLKKQSVSFCLFLFLSLRQPLTKNQITNPKFMCLVICCSHNPKREEAKLSLPFWNCDKDKKPKKKVCYLVFGF